MSVLRHNLRLLTPATAQCRLASTNTLDNDDISPVFTNRNPRNLERLRIAYKPDGYYVDKPGKNFWHRLFLTQSSRHVTASVVHFQNGEVLKASTKEWAIKKQLYKTTDTSAYINLARVFAQRCMESGLTEMSCYIKASHEDGKIAQFLKTLEKAGIVLLEPEQYKTVYPWTRQRSEKPWEVIE